ncbi:hypothetical protein ACLOJK_027235 [Asimina triloba]
MADIACGEGVASLLIMLQLGGIARCQRVSSPSKYEGSLAWLVVVAATTAVGGRTEPKKSRVEMSELLSEVSAILARAWTLILVIGAPVLSRGRKSLFSPLREDQLFFFDIRAKDGARDFPERHQDREMEKGTKTRPQMTKMISLPTDGTR